MFSKTVDDPQYFEGKKSTLISTNIGSCGGIDYQLEFESSFSGLVEVIGGIANPFDPLLPPVGFWFDSEGHQTF